jgi:hypothetical protein
MGIALAPAQSSPVLGAAYRQFNTLRCTRYQHRDVEDAAAGTYYYDCVGFTSYTVKVGAPAAWAELASTVHLPAGRVPTPHLAASFFTRLATDPQPSWEPVATASDLQPGDVLAWWPTRVDATNNGHSVLVLSTPRSLGAGRFAIAVMDSTAAPHGPDDTRHSDNPLSARNAPLSTSTVSTDGAPTQAGTHSGLGIGVIALDTDTSGTVTGVEWTVGTRPEPVSFGAGRPLGAGLAPSAQ